MHRLPRSAFQNVKTSFRNVQYVFHLVNTKSAPLIARAHWSPPLQRRLVGEHHSAVADLAEVDLALRRVSWLSREKGSDSA